MRKQFEFTPEPLRCFRGKGVANVDRPLLCADCSRCRGTVDVGGYVGYMCKLTHTVLAGTGCQLRHMDISNERLCVNCEHYLGGNDWGLSCAKEYHRLVDPMDYGCLDFARRVQDHSDGV